MNMIDFSDVAVFDCETTGLDSVLRKLNYEPRQLKKDMFDIWMFIKSL